MKTILILFSFFTITQVNSNEFHKDTVLKITENGDILGLPKKYRSAKFDLKSKYLKLNDREITFPDCLNDYFDENKISLIRLSGSWYHSKDITPYYLNFLIFQKQSNTIYHIVINLETLELLSIGSSENEENSVSSNIELNDSCFSDYNKAINIIK